MATVLVTVPQCLISLFFLDSGQILQNTAPPVCMPYFHIITIFSEFWKFFVKYCSSTPYRLLFGIPGYFLPEIWFLSVLFPIFPWNSGLFSSWSRAYCSSVSFSQFSPGIPTYFSPKIWFLILSVLFPISRGGTDLETGYGDVPRSWPPFFRLVGAP